MKVKNIMFAGFAAAIFASFANAANAEATYRLASQEYVDEENKLDVKKADANLAEVTDAAGFISSVSQENGKVDAGTTAFIDDVEANPDSLIAPQTAAVKTYVDTQDALDEKVENKVKNTAELQTINDMTDEAAKATKKETSYTSVAVAEKIAADAAKDATGTINIDVVDAEDGKFFNSVGIENGEMKTDTKAFETVIDDTTKDSKIAPQTKAVKDYVDAQNALDVKKDEANMNDVAAAGTFFSTIKQENGVVDTDTTAFIDDVANNQDSLIAPQTKAVKAYVDTAIDEVNSGFEWLDSKDAQKQYIVQTDKDGNEVLVEIEIIGANGQRVYTEVTAPSNTGETPEGN